MTTIYIDKNLTPRYSPNGWPDINRWHPGHGMKQDYLDALEKAKSESIEFENHAIFYPDLKLCTAPDSFIEVEIGEVEVEKQYRLWNGQWRGITEGTTLNEGSQTRTVARVKKQENSAIFIDGDFNNSYESRVRAKVKPLVEDETGPHHHGPIDDSVNAAHGYSEGADIDESVKRIDAMLKSSAQLNADFDHMAKQQEAINELRYQLAAANKRIAELEQPLKARIMRAFQKKWDQDPDRDIITALDAVIDELNIK